MEKVGKPNSKWSKNEPVNKSRNQNRKAENVKYTTIDEVKTIKKKKVKKKMTAGLQSTLNGFLVQDVQGKVFASKTFN